jgi:hypothetical protein
VGYGITHGSWCYQKPNVAPNLFPSTCDNTKNHILITYRIFITTLTISSTHDIHHIYENPQTTYTIYMRIHKHTPYKRIEVIHIVDKRLHIFLIHMTSHPHCLILIHIHNMKPELIRRLTHLTGAPNCSSYVHYHLECH